MNLELLLTIASGFISLLLIVNAFFTRQTLVKLVQIEMKLTESITKQEYIEKQVNENTYEIKKLRDFKNKHEYDYENMINLLENLKNEKH